jgi:hypothetical protein
MTGIFISYRREDSAGWTGRLTSALKKKFGARRVFMDIDALLPGFDYKKSIEMRLASSDVALVIIGPRWLDVLDNSGRRRLDDPEDLARLEIAVTLTREIPVIPVLVGDAALPPAEDLPAELRALTRRHAFRIDDQNWEHDEARLINTIKSKDFRRQSSMQRSSTRRPMIRVASKIVKVVASTLLVVSVMTLAIVAIINLDF